MPNQAEFKLESRYLPWTVKGINHRNKLPMEVLVPLSLDVFVSGIDVILVVKQLQFGSI